jgi:hypothetical protein
VAILAATDVLEGDTVDIGMISHSVEVDGGCYAPRSQRWGVTENKEV